VTARKRPTVTKKRRTAPAKRSHRVSKSLVERTKASSSLVGVSESRGLAWWWPLVREATTGAWQRNEEIQLDNALANPTLYACVTLIATDFAKMRPRLMSLDSDGIWTEFQNTAHSPILRQPNHFQTWFQFAEWWVTSKLTHGNAYALKRRDNRRVVDALYLLDPTRVKLLQAPDGSYFYELEPNNGLGRPDTDDAVIVPASEIIHDVMSPLFHPKLGVSPIFAAGWPALLARYITNNAGKLFQNGSAPGGIITAPGNISKETAQRVKEYVESGFSGDNFGAIMVLGDQMAYTPAGMASAVDSQLIEILRWADEQIAKCFHMPLFKVGGPLPPYSSVEAVTQIYYSDCLQAHATSFEQVFSSGLELPLGMSISLDIEDLNRMDSATQMEIATKGVQGSVLTPNEARHRFDRKPLKGGDTVYLQQQNYSLAALAERDAQDDPFGKTPANPQPAAESTVAETEKRARLLSFKAKVFQGTGQIVVKQLPAVVNG
jgi:HK97 family phage portal protein